MTKSRVHNPGYLVKYFTQFPNIIDDSNLSPFEYRLLIHYYRVGECWEGVRKTSEICKMSTGKVSQCRHSLEEKGFITVNLNGDGIIIHLVDLSILNLKKYSSTDGSGVHVVNTTVHEVNEKRSGGELKKNPVKKNQEEEPLLSPNGESPEKAFDSESKGQLNLEGQVEVLPKKDVPAKKAKNVPRESSGPHKAFIAVWERLYPTIPLRFPRDGRIVKSLIDQTRVLMAKMGMGIEDEKVVEFFDIAMQNLPQFYKGKILPVIDSHYPTIIDEIVNGKNKPTFKNSADQFSKYSGLAR